jgi:hypothetical protein
MIKQMKYYLLLIIALLLSACATEEPGDLVPPGDVSNVKITSTHGGALFTYDVPDDEDLLFIKAVYTNSKGEETFKVSSYYNQSLEIDGFNDTELHNVVLIAVDRSNNHSTGVAVEVTPLVSHIYLVQESISIAPDLGGVRVSWENIAKKTVFVYLSYMEGAIEQERILSSNNAEELFIVRGMDSLDYDIYTQVEDFDGNKTEIEFRAQVKPFFEEKIEKDSWSLLPALSVDGDAWEGLTVNFFDDIIDTKETNDDNSYFIINRDRNGGILNYPLDIVIDMNKQVVVNRFVVWQRAYWYASDGSRDDDYYYYQVENLRSFDIYASNDKQEWLLIGQFDIGDPKDDDGNVPSDKIQEAINGHEFELDNTTDPFRYLKFSITSSFGSETNVYGSEITLYGLDNAGQ